MAAIVPIATSDWDSPWTNEGDAGLAFYTTNNPDDGSGHLNIEERMRIDERGNVGVGTTAPFYKLDINGDIRTNGTLYASSTEITTLTMINASSTQLTVSDKSWLGNLLASGNTISATNDSGLNLYDNASNGITVKRRRQRRHRHDESGRQASYFYCSK